MAAQIDMGPFKQTIPPDLQKQIEDIQIKVLRTTGPPSDLDKEQKRWLIVGICLHSIISPLLRTYVYPIISNLYSSLVSSNSIDTQGYVRYLKKYPASNRYFLNYESINNNSLVPKKKINNKWINDYQNYDYKVASHVDFSKLFLQPSMAHYSNIDHSCDSSALLGMIINISSFPNAVQTDAEKTQLEIRNDWAHIDFTEWTTGKYTDSFNLMGQLVKDIRLSSTEENRILGELNTWATNGHNYLSGTVLGLEIVKEIRQHTNVLSEYVQTLCTEADSQFIKVHKELKKLENSLQDHEDRIKKLENKTMELAAELKCCSELAISNSQKIESLETETTKQEEDNIPKNIRAQHNQDIKVWEDDECTFLKTRATYHILKSLPSNDCIIVTGSSGCGKSSNIHHAALQLRDRWGYEIIPVLTGPIDIINYYNESKKQVFVVDDICGKESINIQTLNNWRDNSERLEKIFKTVEHETNSTFSQITGSKLMISCRLHIYKEEQFQLFKLLTRKECNLLSTDMCLLQDERKLMLEKYIPKAITDSVMKVDEKVDFFPLLCKLAKCKTTKEVIELFTAPVDSIIENINHIVSEKKEQFFALALCLLFDDKFNTDWLKLKSISAEEKKDRLADILKEFEIDLSKEMQRNALKSGFTTLEGTYLKKIGSEYRIIHDKIHEMAAVTCGQRLPECFIKYAPPEFIRDHFIFKSVIEGPVKNDVILLSFDTEKEYFERLLSDLKKSIIISTFNNKQLMYQSFRNKLISFFGKSDETIKILKMIDQKHFTLVKVDMFSCIYKFTTPLIESASCGYLDLVQFLVDTVKCNVNFKNESPALYKALEGGKTDVVKFLCENNASVSKWNMYGNSPLHLACKGGFTDTAELLLENNADVAKCNDSGESPLYVACRGGHVNTVKLLLLYNASVSQCDKHGGRSPLHIVCDRGSLNFHLKHYYPYEKNTSEYEKKKDHIEIVKLLLTGNADVNLCDKEAHTPLDTARNSEFSEIVTLLEESLGLQTPHLK